MTVVGANCTLGPQGLLEVLRQLSRHTTLPLAAQPNAGPPMLLDGRFAYPADGTYFARYARRFVELGAALIGGCCGTTPNHIEAVVQAVAGLRPPPRRLTRPALPLAVAVDPDAPDAGPSRLAARLASGQFLVACQMRPPVGSDADRALRDTALLQEAGADVIAVRGSESTRAQMSPVTLALLLQQRGDVETILTATTWDKSVMTLQADLLGAYAFGIRNVLCPSPARRRRRAITQRPRHLGRRRPGSRRDPARAQRRLRPQPHPHRQADRLLRRRPREPDRGRPRRARSPGPPR